MDRGPLNSQTVLRVSIFRVSGEFESTGNCAERTWDGKIYETSKRSS